MQRVGQKTPGVYYALFQYFWLLVLLPKAVQLPALAGIAGYMLLCHGREKPLDRFTILQLLFLLIYGGSIILNLFLREHETTRVFAAINTWSITVVSVIFYHLYRNTPLDSKRIGKWSLFNLIVLIGLWLLFEVTDGYFGVTPLGKSLAIEDWVDGRLEMRFIGYLDYANLVVFAVLLFYPLALRALWGKRLFQIGLTVILLPVVLSTNSRTGMLLYLLAIAIYFLVVYQKWLFSLYSRYRTAFLTIGSVCIVLMLFAFSGLILSLVQKILEMRTGSNAHRLAIYTDSLRMMWEQSPFIGLGIKDLQEGSIYPLGSHSTYIGVFYKAGILGGLLYLSSLLVLVWNYFKKQDFSRFTFAIKLCLVAVLALMVLEDVDGANWCVCLTYTIMALPNKTTETPGLE